MCRSAARGASVTELTVALFLLTILSSVFIAVFNKSRTVSEGGAKRIELRSLQREAQRRITLLLRSAIAPNEVDPALVAPPLGESAAQVRFCAPANLLDAALTFDPRAPEYPEFTLELDPGGSLLVRRSDNSGVKQLIGRGFQSAEFKRETKRTVAVTLTAETTVRGAAGSRKTVTETSRNLVELPSIR